MPITYIVLYRGGGGLSSSWPLGAHLLMYRLLWQFRSTTSPPHIQDSESL